MGAEESRPQTADVQAPRSPSEKFLTDPMKSLGLVYYPEGDDEEEPLYIDKVADGLYIGSIEGAADNFSLESNRITHILNAENYQSHPNAFRPKSYVYMLSDIPRDKTVQLRQYLPRTNKFIRDARRDDCSVLVHCRDGLTTSAALVLAYLVSEGMSLSAARARLDTVRPGINVSKPYLQQLDDFAREVSKGGTIPTSVTPPARSPGGVSLQHRSVSPKPGLQLETAAFLSVRSERAFFFDMQGTKDTIQSRLVVHRSQSLLATFTPTWVAPLMEGSTFWREVQTPQPEPEYRTKVEDEWENWTEQAYWKRQKDGDGLGATGNDSIEDEGETWDDYSYWMRQRNAVGFCKTAMGMGCCCEI